MQKKCDFCDKTFNGRESQVAANYNIHLVTVHKDLVKIVVK